MAIKVSKIQGTLVALAAAGLFAGCAQKAGSGPSGTCGGAAAESKNSCPAHGNACKGDSCKADTCKEAQSPKDANNCNSKDGCGAP